MEMFGRVKLQRVTRRQAFVRRTCALVLSATTNLPALGWPRIVVPPNKGSGTASSGRAASPRSWTRSSLWPSPLFQRRNMKAKSMTTIDAVPVIEKMLAKGDFGKKKRRALQLAVMALSESKIAANLAENSKVRRTPKVIRKNAEVA